MPIDASLVGRTSEPITRTWTSADALLYALAVGAGQEDPLTELQFTTENTEGLPQQVLPTFCNVAMGGGVALPGDLDLTKMLHAEQAFELMDTIPPDGEAEATGEIVGVYDKGSGALVVSESVARDSAGGPLAKIRTSLFFRGYGGFGGERGTGVTWERPTGAPDHVVTYATRPDQALLYRLTGDRNPLHSDPSFSGRGGFPRPILHGMCTYGFTGRALLHAVAGSDPKRFRAMSGRFTKPIFPGQTLTVSIWTDGSDVRFQTTDDTGAVVIDHGTAVIV
ncbi:MaoC family dehydratase [Nonomuraea aridisoli]|uniref:Enoyl-CoA hydratase n=1 Tax=Nonomuraea aridisoli TaxID=2070368 RepID=A0A2W2F230_9ACTN|nr:MaoC family dehydratase [Nonomuraea aridisoli]PZG15617.1 enoyl-CoA hydratase [Nonomuraea aridisoli]